MPTIEGAGLANMVLAEDNNVAATVTVNATATSIINFSRDQVGIPRIASARAYLLSSNYMTSQL